jgi:dTMP kinase
MNPNRPYPGLFVVLEGADGTGKSLIGEMLEKSLKEAGLKVSLTREPGGTPFSEKIREILLSPDLPDDEVLQMLLFKASRRDHVKRKIIPLLEQGYVVICDRYLLSTLAYQGPNMGHEPLMELHESSIELVPDLMFLIDADVEVIHERINVRSKDEPAGITEWTSPEAILKRKHLYYAALAAMKQRLGPKAYNGGEGWIRIKNNLPPHVAEGEALVHVLRAVKDLIPSRWSGKTQTSGEAGTQSMKEVV